MKNATIACLLLALAVLSAVPGCQSERIASQWRRDAVAVDGDDGEWQHVPRIALDQGKTAVSLQHDNEYLYLLFKTRDQSLVSQIAEHGVQVWLDPYARKARTFGVQFPASMRRSGSPQQPGGMMPAGDSAAARFGRAEPEMVNRMLDESRRHIIITDPEKGDCCTLSVAAADSFGVKAGVGYERGILVCELQLPLRENRQHPYAVAIAGQDSVRTVGLWLESATGAERGGETRPHFTGGGIDMGGKTKPYDQETLDHREELSRPTRLDFWATVELRFPPDLR